MSVNPRFRVELHTSLQDHACRHPLAHDVEERPWLARA